MTTPHRPLHLGCRQLDLLDSLQEGPRSTTALAEDVGEETPRVRRRLRLMGERGLVERRGEVWTLAPLGRQALARALRHGRQPGVPGHCRMYA